MPIRKLRLDQEWLADVVAAMLYHGNITEDGVKYLSERIAFRTGLSTITFAEAVKAYSIKYGPVRATAIPLQLPLRSCIRQGLLCVTHAAYFAKSQDQCELVLTGVSGWENRNTGMSRS